MNRFGWLLVCSAMSLAACGERAPAGDKPDAVYRVRGEIVAMHGSGEDARATVAHEAIPEFEDRGGAVVGMPAMKMAFGIGPGVEAASLTPGSKWELVVDVDWSREPAVRIVEAKPLPADTQLERPADDH